MYITEYNSPLGRLSIAGDGESIIGIWIENQKYFGGKVDLDEAVMAPSLPVFKSTVRWLDIYFSGGKPDFMPPLFASGSEFQKSVWRILQETAYGEITTYGAIAKRLEVQTGKRVSARAVGSAVGHNPISILIPCHRVVGADGSLTGYAGGIDKKLKLLSIEGVDVDGLYVSRPFP